MIRTILWSTGLCVALTVVSNAGTAQPVGVTLSTTISFGDEYTSSIELYDARITVLETVRGAKAWDSVKAADPSNKPPKPGFEYLLARLRFEFAARGVPGDKTYALGEDQFTASSADGTEYDAPSVSQLKPRLAGTLRSGNSLEGWVVFQVPAKDTRPVMIFREDVQSLLRRGAGVMFQLY